MLTDVTFDSDLLNCFTALNDMKSPLFNENGGGTGRALRKHRITGTQFDSGWRSTHLTVVPSQKVKKSRPVAKSTVKAIIITTVPVVDVIIAHC